MTENYRKLAILLIAIFVLFVGMLIFNQASKNSSYAITGAITVQTGQINDIGEQQRGNPNYGALSGTLTLVIKDSQQNVIDTEKGSGYTLYFSRHDISDWNLVKNDAAPYSGTLSNVDADGSSAACSSNTYTTQRKYYDSDNDNTVDPDEFYIYAITTDSNGCFAIKAPPGSYDIYG